MCNNRNVCNNWNMLNHWNWNNWYYRCHDLRRLDNSWNHMISMMNFMNNLLRSYSFFLDFLGFQFFKVIKISDLIHVNVTMTSSLGRLCSSLNRNGSLLFLRMMLNGYLSVHLTSLIILMRNYLVQIVNIFHQIMRLRNLIFLLDFMTGLVHLIKRGNLILKTSGVSTRNWIETF